MGQASHVSNDWSGWRLPTIMACVALLFGNAIALADGPTSMPTSEPEAGAIAAGNSSSDLSAVQPWKRVLTGDDKTRVEELEQRIDELRKVEKYDEAIRLAAEIAEIRERVQGTDHWEVGNARHRTEDLRKLTRLLPQQRAAVANADALGVKIRKIYRTGGYEDATVLARQQLEIRRRMLGDDHPKTLISLENLGISLENQGKYSEAEPYLREAMAGCRRVLGNDHPNTLEAIKNLGGLLQKQGHFSAAEPYLREAMAGCRRVLGNDNPNTLEAISGMGVLLGDQGKYVEAAACYREALTGRRRVLGNDHPVTLTSMNNMAVLLSAQGRYADAATYHREALAGRRRVLDNDHPDTLSSSRHLGKVLMDLGEFAEADPYLREAMAGFRRVLGDTHPSTIVAIETMGCLLISQGKYTEAEPYIREALTGCRRVLGNDHPHTLSSINNMGFVLDSQGKFAEAATYYGEALAGNRRVLGEDHPSTLRSILNLGSLLLAQGKHAEAEQYNRQALSGFRHVLGDDHVDTLSAINNLAWALQVQGKHAEAEHYYREALLGFRRVLGDDHPTTLTSINSMGFQLLEQGRDAEAEPFFREALAGRRRVFGDDHLDTLTSVNDMGGLLSRQGKYTESEKYYREALSGSRRVLGDDSPHTILVIGNFGALLECQGRLAEAERLDREALAGRRRILGDNHPHTLISTYQLGGLLQVGGKLSEAEPYFRKALALAERLRTDVLGDEHGRAAYGESLNLGDISASLTRVLIQLGQPGEAFGVLERGRGRALLDLLARDELDLVQQARTRMAAVGDSSAANELESALSGESAARVSLITAEMRLSALTNERDAAQWVADANSNEQEQVGQLALVTKHVNDQKEQVKMSRSALADASARVFAVLRGFYPDAEPMTAEQIIAGLGADEAVLGYTWRGEWITVLAARGRTQARINADSGDISASGVVLAEGSEVAELTQLAWQVRTSLAERSGPNDREMAATLLEKLVPDSVRSQLAGSKRIVILPDGPLHGIPFEALAAAAVERESGSAGDKSPSVAEWLASGPQVAYAASATMYLNRRAAGREKSKVKSPTALVLGNPIYDLKAQPEPEYPDQGVLIAKVIDGGNAAQAGLTRGDVMLSYDGKPTPHLESLIGTLKSVGQQIEADDRAADDRIAVTYWRDGKKRETTLVPGKMGVQLDRGNLKSGLELIAMRSRGHDEQVAEISATDQVRLHGGTLSPLPGTQREAESIARIIKSASGKVDMLTGDAATIGALESKVEGKRILHIATHGLTGSEARPYDASLALTQPTTPTPGDIGFLTLDHLIRKWRGKLKDCDLVVLSACDTQRGVKKGDSVMALPWGFFYAGAPTVIASLWKVDDTATQLLMTRLYENLLGGYEDERTVAGTEYAAKTRMSKATALREAKQWLRQMTWDELRTQLDISDDVEWERLRGQHLSRGVSTTKPVETEPSKLADSGRPFERPYFWAAFILIGDPGGN